MPAYDYTCEVCGHTFEVVRRMSEEGPKSCPKCKKRKVRQVITVPAYHNHYSPMHPRANRGRGH